MRRLLLLFLLPICLWSWADDDILSSTYKVAKVRYWYDRTGEPQLTTYSGKQITFDASKLIDGFHTFYYQLITTEGDVSPTYSRTFIKISDAESISSISDSYVVSKVRYWYDRGGDLHTSDYTGNSFTLDASSLDDGIHTLYYLLLTKDGHTSSVSSRTFIKVSYAESLSSISDKYVVTGVRYWFDRTGDIQTGTYSSNSFTLDASSLDDGVHTLYYQLLTKDGHTSSVSSRTFIKVSDAESLSSISDKYVVTGVRYWFDRTGNIQTGTYSSNSFTLDASSLDDGVHTLYYQLLTKDGHASSVSSRTFIKVSDAVSNSAFSSSYVVKSVRYWFDRKGVVNTGSYNGKSFTLDASKLEDGMHTLYYQLVTDEGHVSSTHVRMFIKVSKDGSISTIEGKYVPKTIRYWVDNDTIIQTRDYSSGILSHNMANLEEGAHWLYYQIVTEDGHTSPVHRQMFERSLFDITIGKTQTLKEGNYSNSLLAARPWLALNNRLSDASVLGHLTVEEGDTLSLGKFVQRLHFGNSTASDKFTNNGENYYHLSTLMNQGMTRSDSVFIEASFYKNRWHFISVPFNVKVTDIKTEKGVRWVIRTYDGKERAAGRVNNTWKNLTENDVLVPGTGYIIQATRSDDSNVCRFTFPASDDSKKNNIFKTGDQAVELNEYIAEFAHNRSWNFIANPYPSFYEIGCSNISVPITVWNGNGYTAYSMTDDRYVLMPYESFFVQCPLNSNEVVFGATGRQHSHELSAEKQAARARAIGDAGRHIHNFWLSDSVYRDRCRIVINDAASMSYEQDKDASKFMSTNADVPQIYSVGSGVAYAINEMPLGEAIVPIAIYAGNNSELTLHYEAGANAMDEVVLVDAQEGKSYDLTDGDVELSAAAGSIVSGRYYISFISGTTAIEKIANDESLDSESAPIYDIQGRKVNTKRKGEVYIQDGVKFFENKQ